VEHVDIAVPAAAVGTSITVTSAVLFELMTLLQEPDAILVIVIVVKPRFVNEEEGITNDPVPAVVTAIDGRPDAVLALLRV
jgi:hypothetical protein